MSLKHLILGLLSTKSQSGYDLNKTFQQSVENFWTTDQSQIYRALYSMKKQGWVEQEIIVQDDHPDKKVYHLTSAGEQELMTWLKTPITRKEAPVREGWLGQLYFGHHLTNAELMQTLVVYIDDMQQEIDHLNQIKQLHFGESPETMPRRRRLSMLTLEYGLHIMEATKAWMQQTHDEISNMDDVDTSNET